MSNAAAGQGIVDAGASLREMDRRFSSPNQRALHDGGNERIGFGPGRARVSGEAIA
jgi:hypothetical protein